MTGSTETVDASILERVQRLLEGLKKTADGDILYGLIERALRPQLDGLTARFGELGIEIVATQVDELLTVQEMAGFQMCAAKMDDELIELWNAPCNTPSWTVS